MTRLPAPPRNTGFKNVHVSTKTPEEDDEFILVVRNSSFILLPVKQLLVLKGKAFWESLSLSGGKSLTPPEERGMEGQLVPEDHFLLMFYLHSGSARLLGTRMKRNHLLSLRDSI